MTIDAGTGSVRAVIFDIDGNQIAISQREWEHKSEAGVPNSMSFDFDVNWELTQTCIKESIQNAGINGADIVALSSSSMREGIVLYDKEGKELFGVANVDARADQEVKYLKENFDGIEEAFYARSGQTFALGAIPRILWLKNNRPALYEKAAKFSMISDWILYKISGEFSSEPTNAGTSGIFSLSQRDYAADMMEKVGLKSDIFPKCYECGEVIGNVSQETSKATGLSTKCLAVTGGGDVQLGTVGLGITALGQSAILGGSFWQQVVNIPSTAALPEDMSIRINPHIIKGQSQAEGITFFSGLIMRWFRDAFCEMEKIEAAKQNMDVYALLEQKAKEVPLGSYGIMPIFSDSMKYGKWYHASPSFLGLGIDSSKYNKYSMFRALQENACIVSAINLDKIYQFAGISSAQSNTPTTFAAGASKGALWSQILADVTGRAVKVPKVKEATSLGGAFAAGIAAGIYSSFEEVAKELVVIEKEYEPDRHNYKQYQELKSKWQQVYNEQLKLVDDGLLESMWKAPGI
jgi:autoinducer 2 (AI-2) kinase